jgi:hypothetical protein
MVILIHLPAFVIHKDTLTEDAMSAKLQPGGKIQFSRSTQERAAIASRLARQEIS